MFDKDRPEHSQPVAQCVEVADTVNSQPLNTWHLSDRQGRRGDSATEKRLDLTTVAPNHPIFSQILCVRGRQVEVLEYVTPERVVHVTKVRGLSPEEEVIQAVKGAVPRVSQACDVLTATALHTSTAFGIVGTSDKRVDETRDLLGISGTIRVEHDNDVAGRSSETAYHGVALAET